ncbi:phospho-sugar mutase [candidate division WWE3 bacterium CG_4_10_14_0_2_um_filter_41_14]|uniref:Phospho-sugar mutase n=1 Tax=candidate division WWE3 bacterium CG_4_10_14_0_2_um_filter_41_14 TaxID=1975072 RepID=A0A2M7TEX4_UNCKA|nr:MAG: phospho-sugar mutase [candidate division WWE3 bacterium CG_4_10_14_0_2_um_filter_41_14]
MGDSVAPVQNFDTSILLRIKAGFDTLLIPESYKIAALHFLEQWLTQPEFLAYRQQIIHLVQNCYWNYLLDSFYQVIPFGTAGRRGEVGIGPNRINPYTIQASAQGHSQFLLKKYGDEVKTRGVVFAYDVRFFSGNSYISSELENPVHNISSKDLTLAAAQVYAANGIPVFLFSDIRTTPELSFAIRHLNAIAGDMFSASHNPPDHNGKKVFDEHGGQLIPPFDENLVLEVTTHVKNILRIPISEAYEKNLIIDIDEKVDHAYISAVSKVSLSNARDITIAFTPLHGCGISSVKKVLSHVGFDVHVDPKTGFPSGTFENITFNIPNPEVVESFETSLTFADQIDANILISTDPDGDRFGIMVKHHGSWVFLTGNEIATICMAYVAQKRTKQHKTAGMAFKTMVTTNAVENICRSYGIKLMGELLVGFKYIGNEMNQLEQTGRMDDFVFACEESHGFLAGNFARDKDAVVPAIWLSELAAELKVVGKTLIDYLDDVYKTYGYYLNYVTEIRLLGAIGSEKVTKIQSGLRNNPPKNFGAFAVEKFEDCQNRKPIISSTDLVSKDVLIFHFEKIGEFDRVRVTVRPSNTEPKIKMYFEIGSSTPSTKPLDEEKIMAEDIRAKLELSVMTTCYQLIGVDFPKRGFLLFWQLPLDVKLKYFEIEQHIVNLSSEPNVTVRRQKLNELLSFLGSDPIQKVDKAFMAEYGKGMEEYLEL